MHQHGVKVIHRLGRSPGACLGAQEWRQVERGRKRDFLVDLATEPAVEALELDCEDRRRALDGELLEGAHFLAAPGRREERVVRLRDQ